MSTYQIIYWRNIPVQIRVRSDSDRHTMLLPDRFQQAVKRAAFRAKAITGESYMAAWNSSDWQVHPGDPQQALRAVLLDIEARYPDEILLALIRNKGYHEKPDVED